MKVLYIITRSDTVGGAQRHVFELAHELRVIGHDALVVCGKGTPLQDLLKTNNVPFVVIPEMVRNFNLIKDVIAYRKLRKIIQDYDPDIVSTHSSKAGVIGRLAAKSCSKPGFFTAHGWSFTDGVGSVVGIIYRNIELLMSLCSTKIICVSNYDRQLAARVGMNSIKLVTVHNSRHDISECDFALHEKKEVVRILMVGRLSKQKDHLTLFRALSSLKDFELLLLGDGPFRDSLEEEADRLGVLDKTRFLGLTLDTDSVYKNADIFCLISNWEGFPRSTLEAMRAGLPVIVSDVGGSKEAVIEGKTGFVVKKGDFATLRDRLSMLIDSHDLRKKMGANARKRFEEKFLFKYMFETTLTLYLDELAQS